MKIYSSFLLIALRYQLDSLEVLGSVGEPINPEAWQWYHKVVGGGRCSIVDTFWQSETVRALHVLDMLMYILVGSKGILIIKLFVKIKLLKMKPFQFHKQSNYLQSMCVKCFSKKWCLDKIPALKFKLQLIICLKCS